MKVQIAGIRVTTIQLIPETYFEAVWMSHFMEGKEGDGGDKLNGWFPVSSKADRDLEEPDSFTISIS